MPALPPRGKLDESYEERPITEAEFRWLEQHYPVSPGMPYKRSRMTAFQLRYGAVREYASRATPLRRTDGRTPEQRETEDKRLTQWLKDHYDEVEGRVTSGVMTRARRRAEEAKREAGWDKALPAGCAFPPLLARLLGAVADWLSTDDER